MKINRTLMGIAFVAAGSLAAGTTLADESRPWLPWTEKYTLLIEACSKDGKTLAFGMSYTVPDNAAFEIEFTAMLRRIVGRINADEFGSVAWDMAYFSEWTKPLWEGGATIYEFFGKTPPTLEFKGTADQCFPDLKPAI